jgi:hypothetical protein
MEFAPNGPSLQNIPSMHTASGMPLRQSSLKSRQLSGSDRTVVADRIVGFLRREYPFATAENVSADTGVAIATVQKWIERDSAPSCSSFLRLVSVYGPEFLAAVCPDRLGWLDAAARAEHDRKVRAEIAALEQRLGRP